MHTLRKKCLSKQSIEDKNDEKDRKRAKNFLSIENAIEKGKTRVNGLLYKHITESE